MDTLGIAAAISAAVLGSFALQATAQQPAGEARPAQRMHQDGNIRIFYYAEGEHAVDPGDLNRNEVPDQVEDALTQTRAAEILFVRAMGFPDPFETARYNGASFLDIHFRNKEVLKGNGKAYDELQRYNRLIDAKGTLSLGIGVATSVKPSANATPAHEFFHVIQNSTTFFKNRWFTEGTARWSERPFVGAESRPVRSLGTWPLPPEKSTLLFEMTYEAAGHFWKPLIARFDSEAAFPEMELAQQLKSMTYVDGTKVLKDIYLHGWRLIRDVLVELDRADDSAFRQLAYDRWSEENQRSAKNNPFIMEAVHQALKRRGASF